MRGIELGGESLTLLPQKAAYLPRYESLLIADAHIGKAQTFRRLGVPVPRGTTNETLDGITGLIAMTGARRVIFLGDFLHSRHAHAPTTIGHVARWREQHAQIDVLLVRGNHDDRAGDPPAFLRFEVVDEPFSLGGLALSHHPKPRVGRFVLAGHLHPCVLLGGRAHDRLRLACFHIGADVGVLPAFGAFTGMHPIRTSMGDRVFAVADDRVIEV